MESVKLGMGTNKAAFSTKPTGSLAKGSTPASRCLFLYDRALRFARHSVSHTNLSCPLTWGSLVSCSRSLTVKENFRLSWMAIHALLSLIYALLLALQNHVPHSRCWAVLLALFWLSCSYVSCSGSLSYRLFCWLCGLSLPFDWTRSEMSNEFKNLKQGHMEVHTWPKAWHTVSYFWKLTAWVRHSPLDGLFFHNMIHAVIMRNDIWWCAMFYLEQGTKKT